MTRTPKGAPLAWLLDALENANADQCLLWPFGVNPQGYGLISRNGRTMPAHHLALLIWDGLLFAPPEKPFALHAPHSICGHKNCVNPHHLRWGTHAENMADMVADGTATGGCGVGGGDVPRGEAHYRARLTEPDVIAIRKDERPVRLVAAAYGVVEKHIYDIRNRKRWAHVV